MKYIKILIPAVILVITAFMVPFSYVVIALCLIIGVILSISAYSLYLQYVDKKKFEAYKKLQDHERLMAMEKRSKKVGEEELKQESAKDVD